LLVGVIGLTTLSADDKPQADKTLSEKSAPKSAENITQLPALVETSAPVKTSVDAKPAKSTPATKPAGEKTQADHPPFTAEDEALALEFARQNHPELAKLIKNLATKNPNQYNKAVQELIRNRTRLEKVKERSQPRYDRDLALWVVDSKIRLLVARMVVKDGQVDDEQLSQLLHEKREVEIRYLTHETERLAADSKKMSERSEKMHRELSEKQSSIDEWVTSEKVRLLQSAKNSRKPLPNIKTNSAKKSPPAIEPKK
jgi:hypothetical protein